MDIFSQFLKELGPARIVATAMAILIFIVLISLYLFKISGQNMAVLFSDLEIDDSNRIIQELDSKNIPYEIIGGGAVIKVPEEKVLRLRMVMAEIGLPLKGSIVGYEVFDGGESISTSNFLQNVNLVRALEGELSRTISTFENVRKARVHLVVPKKDLFSREKQEPRASVVLTMKGQKYLKKAEINAISHLVVTAIPSLDINQVTIVDTKGRPLKLGSKEGNFAESQAEEMKNSHEIRLKNIIEDLLERTIGVGKVKSYVTADINFDRIITNSEIYDPDGRVPRSVLTVEERESNSSGSDGGDSSVANNLPNAQGGGGGDKNVSNTERIDETTNFEISKTIKNHISETGTIRRLSVAVLVDGIYKLDKETNQVTYQPRSNEDLEKYKTLVQSAIGFREGRGDKIEVINMPFLSDMDSMREDETVEWMKSELPLMVQTVVIGGVAIIVLILVVRPIAIRAFEVSRNDVDVVNTQDHIAIMTRTTVDPEEKTAIQNIQEAIADADEGTVDIKANPKVNKLNDIVNNNLQETVNVLRKWINED